MKRFAVTYPNISRKMLLLSINIMVTRQKCFKNLQKYLVTKAVRLLL